MSWVMAAWFGWSLRGLTARRECVLRGTARSVRTVYSCRCSRSLFCLPLCASHGLNCPAAVSELAEHLGWDSGRLRLVWVLATVFTAFAGIVIYLALWYLMPAEPPKPLPFDPPPLQPWKRSV